MDTSIDIAVYYKHLYVYKTKANSSIPLQNVNVNSINSIVGASCDLVKG